MEATGDSGPSVCRYDVFLSFRGPDTRNTFTDCLYRTMLGQGIVAYIDNEDLEVGNRIDDLLTAIVNSKICIPVFSRGYASSAWCLRELARMMDLYESTGKPAIMPIFFDVTPLDVKLRTKAYGDDMEKHEQRHGKEIRQQWEAALRKVAEIKGHEVQGKKHGEVIELVVKEVLRKLKVKQRHLDEKLVGVDEQVESIMELLDVDSGTDVLFIGIYGMGGIGKTTLAKIVFNKLCSRFDGRCSFIENIRESSKGNGLVDLQKKLASDISDSRFVENFSTADEGMDSIRRRAGSKKVVIVLDDLDKKEQLKKLVGGPNIFCSGSRIIITARDKRIMDEENRILAYQVKQMDSDKALELFSLHAFSNVSPPNTHQSLSQEVVSTTGGLPLALKVIGSSLRGKEEKIWKAMLNELKKVPHDEVLATLKISYDVLRHKEKEIFLDIACFFIGKSASTATYFWDACNLSPVFTLEKLKDLCLIEIRGNDVLWMHDQLRDLGRDIVLEERTQNRLWDYEEALEVVKSKERKDKLQALNLCKYKSNPISIADEELERMPNLKFLELNSGTFVGVVSRFLQELRWFSWSLPPLDGTTAKLHLENLAVFELSYNENTEEWGGWNILKMENKLKVLSLSGCNGLKRTPDFSGCLSLEELSIQNSSNLQEIDPSIGKLKGLTRLNIRSCKRLQKLPEEIGGLVNLEYFHIRFCKALEEVPLSFFKFASLSELCLHNTKISHLPDSIGNAKHLSALNVSGTPIVELPTEIGELSSLTILDISSTRVCAVPTTIISLIRLQKLDLMGCDELEELPKLPPNLTHLRVRSTSLRLVTDLSNLTNLVELILSTGFGPPRAQALSPMQTLQLQGIGKLSKLEKLTSHFPVPPTELDHLTRLTELFLSGVDSFDSITVGTQFSNLKYLSKLSLEGSQRREMQLVGLELLRELNVSHFDLLEGLSFMPSSLRKIRQIAIWSCPRLLEIRLLESMMESLEEFSIESCKSLAVVRGLSNAEALQNLAIGRCNELQVVEGLERLYVSECGSLVGLPDVSSNSKIPKKCSIDIWGCAKLIDYQGTCEYNRERIKKVLKIKGMLIVELPISIGELVQLEFLEISECEKLRELPESIGNLTSLQELNINDTIIVELPDSIKNLKQLKVLKIGRTPIVELPISIGALVQLEFLKLYECENLRELPESIGNLTSLRNLDISYTIIVELPDSIKNLKQLNVLKIGWTPIVELPISIGELVQLEFLELADCENLLELPESIGNLTLLQNLDISNTIIDELPESIKNLKQLKVLKIGWTPIVELPISIGEFMKLEFLELSNCENLLKLPESIGNLTSLQNLDISDTIIFELPNSIQNLKQLRVLKMERSQIRRLPAGIGMLKRLDQLHAQGCEQLAGELPLEIGRLSSLSILDIADTHVCAVPTAIIYLTRLRKMDLMNCNKLQELPKLPPSLTCLRVQTRSLRLVPDLSYLTKLVELILSTGFGPARAWASSPMQTLQLQWVGKLSNLQILCSDAPAPSLELGRLTRLENLTLSGMDSFDSITVGPQFSNMKCLSKLTLYYSPLREMQLAGLEQLRELTVSSFDLLEGLSFMPSCLKKICKIAVAKCPRLLEIRFLGAMMESLQFLHIDNLKSLAVLRGLSNAEKLGNLQIFGCDKLQVVEGLEGLCISECGPLEGLTDVSSNSIIPNECEIYIRGCAKLSGHVGTYGNYREMIKKKDAMENDSENRKKKKERLI